MSLAGTGRIFRASPPWHAGLGGREMAARAARPYSISFCDAGKCPEMTGAGNDLGPLKRAPAMHGSGSPAARRGASCPPIHRRCWHGI